MPVAGISLDNWTSQYDNNAHHCTIVYVKVIHSQIFYWDRPSSTNLLCASSEGPDETALCAMRRLVWSFTDRLCRQVQNIQFSLLVIVTSLYGSTWPYIT